MVGLLITKLRKVYCCVNKKTFLIDEYLAHLKQERGCFMHFARLANTLLQDIDHSYIIANL